MLNICENDLEIKEYIRNYQNTKDIRIRNELITHLYKGLRPYCIYFYNRYKFFDRETYKYLLSETLINVIETYDLTKNCTFATYFFNKARWGILDNIRNIRGRKNQKIYKFNSLDANINNENYNLYCFLPDNRIDIERDYILMDEYNRYIKRCEAILNEIKAEKSKRVFREYYFNGLSYNEIAKKIGIKANSVSSIVSHYHKKYSLFLH